MGDVYMARSGYGPKAKYKIRVVGVESSTYIREKIADILKPKNNILVLELKELLTQVDHKTNFYEKNFGCPDHFGWVSTDIEITCDDGGCEIIFDCAPHPVKIEAWTQTAEKFEIKEKTQEMPRCLCKPEVMDHFLKAGTKFQPL